MTVCECVGALVEEKKVTDHELDRDREHTWFCLSKAVAIIAVVCGTVAFGWILSAGDEEKMLRRAEIATPLGMAFAAALTFTTVVWRGLVGEFQAREQKRANDQKDEENIVKLLLDGTRLLHSGSGIENTVGTAALEQVVNSRFSKNAQVAMNLLADFTFKNATNHFKESLLKMVSEAMLTGVKSGYRADRRVEFNVNKCIGLPSVIVGFTELGLTNAAILHGQGSSPDQGQKVTYDQCRIAGLTFGANETIGRECSIEDCKLWHLKLESIQHNHFYQSNFSNTLITFASASDRLLRNRQLLDDHIGSNAILQNLRHCFYYRGSPPTGDGAHLILPYLEARDRTTT